MKRNKPETSLTKSFKIFNDAIHDQLGGVKLNPDYDPRAKLVWIDYCAELRRLDKEQPCTREERDKRAIVVFNRLMDELGSKENFTRK